MVPFFSQKRSYLDYAGATPPSRAALRAYERALRYTGNPGSLHQEGVAAHDALERARTSIARTFECKTSEIVFTSGATESNNILIQGIAEPLRAQGKAVHVITTSLEHASVLEPCAALEEKGVTVTYLEPDHTGNITPESLSAALTDATVLVSIGWANSEIGVAQRLGVLARIIRSFEKEHGTKIVFHTDAGQAPLYFPAMVSGLGVDVLTLDSGKLYGPRGIGALILRNAHPEPIVFGGGQEGGLRPGTESVALASGFAAALTEANILREKEGVRLRSLRAKLFEGITQIAPHAVINGDTRTMLPHVLNVSIPNIDPEYLVLRLDALGIAIATKSACEEGERLSHVVYALDPEHPWRAAGTLRFSFGRESTSHDVHAALRALRQALQETKGSVLRYHHHDEGHEHEESH